MATSRWQPLVLLALGLFPAAAAAAQLVAPLASGWPAPLPPLLVANRGQHPQEVRFSARQGALSAFFTDEGLSFVLAPPASELEAPRAGCVPPGQDTAADARAAQALRLRFLGRSPELRVVGEGPLAARINSYHGDAPQRWVSGAETFAGLRYVGLYPGVDLSVVARDGRLAYDLLLAPGADTAQIVVACEGDVALELADERRLLLHTPAGTLEQDLPAAWEVDEAGREHPLQAGFRLLDATHFGFDVGPRQAGRAAVIDPGLTYGSFLGGSLLDTAVAVGVAPGGDILLAGTTGSADFPTTPGAVQRTRAGNNDAYLARLDAGSGQLVYATFFGGNDSTTFEPEGARDLAVAADGSVTVVGRADSANFPTTAGTVGVLNAGGADGFAARFDAGGALLWSTRVGGSGQDEIRAVALHPDGRLTVAGVTYSNDFPVTGGAYDTSFNSVFFTNDAFVARLTADAGAYQYATYLGGSLRDEALDVALAADGSAFVVGLTGSPDLPATPGAYDTSFNGSQPNATDAFVAHLSANGQALSWCTYFGGAGIVEGTSIALAADGQPLLGGTTRSSDLPTTPGAFQPAFGGGLSDAFLARLDTLGQQLVWCTYFGGSGEDTLSGLALHEGALPTFVGSSASTDLPVRGAAPVSVVGGGRTGGLAGHPVSSGPAPGPAGLPTTPAGLPMLRPVYDRQLDGSRDAYVARLGVQGGQLLYGSYYGGSAIEDGEALALDGFGAAWLAGQTESPDLPLAGASYESSFQGARDGLVARFALPPFEDLGLASAGPDGRVPRLLAFGGLDAGAPLRLRLEGARPGAPVLLLAARRLGPLAWLPGRYGPSPVEQVLMLHTGPEGDCELELSALPATLPAGGRYALQAWVLDPSAPDGGAASNVLGLLAP